jgi:predicted TPR repeat methyltransferase
MSADEDNLTYTQGVIDVIKTHLKQNGTDNTQGSMTLDEIIASVRQQVAKDDETMPSSGLSPSQSPSPFVATAPKSEADHQSQPQPVAPAILENALVTRGNSYEYRVPGATDSLDTGQHTYHVNELLRFYDETFIINVYHALLKRAPDEGGMFHYLKELRGGRISRIDIIAGMFLSAEGKLAKVKIKGLWLPFLSSRLYRLPVIGYLLHIASGIANLPRIMRALTNVESHQFVAQQQDRNDLRHLSEQVSASFAKVDSNLQLAANAVDQQSGAHQQTKAQLSQLQSMSIDEKQLQAHLADKADKRWTKEQLADKADQSWSEGQFTQLQQSKIDSEQLEQKADKHWVDAHLSEQLADLQLAEQLALKADNDWVEQQLAKKADNEWAQQQLAEKADSEWVNQQLTDQLAKKADSEWVDQQLTEQLAEKADLQWVDDKLEGKTSPDWVKLQLAEKADGHWTKSELASKADNQQVNDRLAQKAGLQWTSERLAEKVGIQWASERLAEKASLPWASERLAEKAGLQWANEKLQEKADIQWAKQKLQEKSASQWVNERLLEKASSQWVNERLLEKVSSQQIDEQLSEKASSQWVNEQLLDKASSQWVNEQLLDKADIQWTNEHLALKAQGTELEALNALVERNDKDVKLDDALYQKFEEAFRGSTEMITERLGVYRPLIESLFGTVVKVGAGEHHQAIDIGCGRGEWLQLLQGLGVNAIGVDISQTMVQTCNDKGLQVHATDGVEYLRAQADNSVSLISGFHIIEHISFGQLLELFTQTARVLKPGGMVIFETPNPKNLLVGSADFYLDPTHQRPLHPMTMQFFLRNAGINTVKVNYVDDKGLTDHDDIGFDSIDDYVSIARDYVLIGTKKEGTKQ